MLWGKKKQEQQDYSEDLKNFLGEGREEGAILTILSYFTDGVLVFDKHNKLAIINPQAETFLEVKKEEVLGQPILKLGSSSGFRPLVSILGGGLLEIKKKEVRINWNLILEVSSFPMMAGQEKIGDLVVLHDITREKTVELMKNEFITLAAHQLRTPTSAVKWSLQMLLEGDLGKVPKEQKDVIKKAYDTNDKAIHLVKDLLNIARIEEGKFLSQITLSSIEEVVRSVAEEYKDEIERRKLKIELRKAHEEIPKVMIDVDKMKIAIGNIIDNAARYTPAGGKIAIMLLVRNEEVEIQIKDTGVGIPEDQTDKIFTKFFRASNVIRIETEGSGLGLFITKYIVEAHGGRIWFESREGRGTIFYLALPLKQEFAEYLTKDFY